MERSTRFLVAVGILAVLAALAGSLVSIGGGEERDTGVPVPAGDDNVLRIEPAEDEVSCGSSAVVNLYLDDLTIHPSPLGATVPHGIAGFQIIIRYDPAVLRLGPGADVELGQRLGTFDRDGDGVTRSFFVVQDVDDYTGRAVIGAGSLVTNTSAAGGSKEEGPEPVGQGAPLLLMSINVHAIGHGEGALTLSVHENDLSEDLGRSAIIDPSGVFYEPVTVKSSSLTVAGGDCPDVPQITPRPTMGPTATEPAEPTVTPVAWS